MPTQLERLAVELLGLPAKTRAVLAEQLIASLEQDEPRETDDVVAVARRRSDELAAGKVEGVPADEVFDQLDRELG